MDSLYEEGKLRIPLAALRPADQFTHTHDLVTVLREPFHSIACSITPDERDALLRRLNLGLEQFRKCQTPPWLKDEPVTCAYSRLSLDRAKAELGENFICNVQLYCTPPIPLKSCDGDVFRNLRLNIAEADPRRIAVAQAWMNTLSAPKRHALVLMLKRPDIMAALDSMLVFPGHWKGLQLGNWTKHLAAHVDPAIVNYWAHMKDTWATIMAKNETMYHLVTAEDVELLQHRAPAWSSSDRHYIRNAFRSRQLFPLIRDTALRKKMLQQTLQLQSRMGGAWATTIKKLNEDVQCNVAKSKKRQTISRHLAVQIGELASQISVMSDIADDQPDAEDVDMQDSSQNTKEKLRALQKSRLEKVKAASRKAELGARLSGVGKLGSKADAQHDRRRVRRILGPNLGSQPKGNAATSAASTELIDIPEVRSAVAPLQLNDRTTSGNLQFDAGQDGSLATSAVGLHSVMSQPTATIIDPQLAPNAAALQASNALEIPEMQSSMAPFPIDGAITRSAAPSEAPVALETTQPEVQSSSATATGMKRTADIATGLPENLRPLRRQKINPSDTASEQLQMPSLKPSFKFSSQRHVPFNSGEGPSEPRRLHQSSDQHYAQRYIPSNIRIRVPETDFIVERYFAGIPEPTDELFPIESDSGSPGQLISRVIYVSYAVCYSG
ncbi:hypothetical protein MY10362_004765 [Beauveria mimosiformis]